jgi:L-lactate permease
VRTFGKTIWLVRYSLLTIVLMLALGTLTRYSGPTPPWAWPSPTPACSIPSSAP